MLVINGLIAILLEFIIFLLVGASLVIITSVILYFNKESVMSAIYFIWSRVSKDSYEDYMRRVEADKKFKEKNVEWK